MFAVEIYYYEAEEPITVQLEGDRAAAESYLADLRRDVAEAQERGRPRLRIDPREPSQKSHIVEPSKIQRVILVE